MTGDDRSNRWGRYQSGLFRDTRGHVPFAVISVFLLVTSMMIVGYLQTRPDSSVDDDIDTAMDRTDAAVQAAVREGVTRATERAARQPLTTAANSSFGRVLGSDDPFEDYLRALVYIETRTQLQSTGQAVGDVQTNVSLPPIEDADSFARAIDSVSITRSTETESTNTTLTVTVSEITTTATRNGDGVAHETDDVTLTVVTPLMELHERTEQFQNALDTGLSSPGLSQRFNARIYALGWARGYAQYAGMPVTEVLANRHVKPSVNDAIYRTQKDIFGAADPQLNNAVRRGWLCMAMQDAQSLYQEYSSNAVERDIAGDICDSSKWVFGDEATGQLPSAPDTLDLLGDAPGMDSNLTIGVNETAYLPLGSLTAEDGEHSFNATLERMFTVTTALNTNYDRGEFNVSLDCTYGSRGSDRTNTDTEIVRSELEKRTAKGEFYAFNGTVVNTVKATTYCWKTRQHEETKTKSVERKFHVTVDLLVEEEETNPGANIDSVNGDLGIEYKYRRGPGETVRESPIGRTPPVPGNDSFRNYDGIGDNISRQIFGGTSVDAFERWLSEHARGAVHPKDVSIPDSRTVTVDHSQFLDFAFRRALTADISRLQANISAVSHTFERREMVHQGRDSDGGPIEGLLETVRDHRRANLERDEPYVNVGQKVIYEARYSYFELLESKLVELDTAHDRSMHQLDDKLSAADSGIEDAVSHLQQGMTATAPEPVPIQSGDHISNLSYEVSGSPTYFVTENVTKADVPQVDTGVTYAPMATKNENYFRMPYDAIASGLIGAVLDNIGWGNPSAEISFRTAGDALRAGKLAKAAAQETNGSYTDSDLLASLTGDVETATTDAIDSFETDVTTRIAIALYPDDTEIFCNYGSTSCRPAGLEIPDDCGDNATCVLEENSTGETASQAIESAVTDALDSYDTTAERAIAIGDGDSTDRIIEYVASELYESEYRPEYADSLSADQWEAVINSSVRPAILSAAGESTVEIGGTATIKKLDAQTRTALENVTTDLLRDRLDGFPENHINITDTKYDDWLDGQNSPLRVPAGLPITPVPGYWFATLNVWDVEASGQYARFELKANMGTPETATATSYVRENRTVEISVANGTKRLGSVEAIDFSARSMLVVVVPPGGVGVGDRDGADPECSPTWPVVGNVKNGSFNCLPFDINTEHDCEGGQCDETSEERAQIGDRPPRQLQSFKQFIRRQV